MRNSKISSVGRLSPDQKTRQQPAATSPPRGSQTLSPDAPHQQKLHRDNGDRGRQAESPAHIPVKGWKDVTLRIYHGISEDRIVAISAGVTFFTLLALFPGIAGLISLYGFVADPASMEQHVRMLSGVLPEGGMQIIGDQIQRLASQPSEKLGFGMLAGLAIAMWSANGGMKAMFDALNIVYREKEKRGFIKLNITSLAITLGGVLFVVIALLSITIVPVLLTYLGLSQFFELVVKVGRWPVLVLVVIFAMAVIYRYGPSRDKPKWRWTSPGSILATVLWLAASLLFSWYAENFGSYNKTYGSLGAVIGFMTWLWLSTIVILLGAKLNAELEHQTVKDTTEGRPQPLGQRKAYVADTVGAASDTSSR
jgi:membrane protein